MQALPKGADDRIVDVLAAKSGERRRPWLEGHGDYVFGVLVAMAPIPEEDRIESQELYFVATADRLVVVRKTPPTGRAFGTTAASRPPRTLGVGAAVSTGRRRRRASPTSSSSMPSYAEIDELEDNIDRWPSLRVRRGSPTSATTCSMRAASSARPRRGAANSRRTARPRRRNALPARGRAASSPTRTTTSSARGEELDVARDLLAGVARPPPVEDRGEPERGRRRSSR